MTRIMTVPAKTVAHYSGKSDRTIRRMCADGEIDAVLVGGEWLISPEGIMRKYYKLGPDTWRRILYDLYTDKNDAESAFRDFVSIYAIERDKERRRKGLA